MPTKYQTYGTDASITDYRNDTIHRSAMCEALASKHPALAAVATEANTILAQIDARVTVLQQAEDAQVRARAVEEAEKFDVAESYTELRRTMAAKSYDIHTLLPDAPSVFGKLGIKTLGGRADQAVANLKELPEGDPVKAAFLPKLEKDLADFRKADLAEDLTRTTMEGVRVALILYKSELSQTREAQLGAIQNVFGDREKAARFTLPWRKPSKRKGESDDGGADDGPGNGADTTQAPAAPAAPGAPPAKPPT